MVSDALRTRWAELAVETKVIRTSGDEQKVDIVAARAGRKGLFTSEIERALLAEEVDLAVHSAKDLPSELSASTEIGAVLPRAPTAASWRRIDGTRSFWRAPGWSGSVITWS